MNPYAFAAAQWLYYAHHKAVKNAPHFAALPAEEQREWADRAADFPGIQNAMALVEDLQSDLSPRNKGEAA